MSFFVDVHTHLTHEDFAQDWQQVLSRAVTAGLGAIVVNGLEPVSNRQILAWAKTYPVIRPAIGIYPLDAINDRLPADFPFPVAPFDVDAEIAFIREQAAAGHLAAVGECGLDAYYLPVEYLPAQERVLRR